MPTHHRLQQINRKRLKKQYAAASQQHDDSIKVLTTYKGERLRGRLTEIASLKHTFNCMTFLKHMLFEIFGVLSLPWQLFYNGRPLTMLTGSFLCGPCARAWAFSKETNRTVVRQFHPVLVYFHVAQHFAFPFFVWSQIPIQKSSPVVNNTGTISGIYSCLLTYFLVFLLRNVAISIKYATQPARALLCLKYRPKQNTKMWENFHLGSYRTWHASQLFERMQILLTLQGIPTQQRKDLSFDFMFASHQAAKNHVAKVLVFLFPETIPTLKKQVIHCLEHNHYLSTINIIPFPTDDARNMHRVRVPAVLMGIALTMQENIGTKRNQCIKYVLLLCVFLCTLCPALAMFLFDVPEIHFDANEFQHPNMLNELQCIGLSNLTRY